MLANFDDLLKKIDSKFLLIFKFKDMETYNRFLRSINDDIR